MNKSVTRPDYTHTAVCVHTNCNVCVCVVLNTRTVSLPPPRLSKPQHGAVCLERYIPLSGVGPVDPPTTLLL